MSAAEAPPRGARDLRGRYTAADLQVLTADEARRFVSAGADPQADPALAWELLYRLEPELYDRLVRAERIHPAVLAWLPRRVERILEVGAGTGRLTFELLGRADEIVAIEPAAPLRERLIKRLARTELGHGATVVDAFFDDLPLPDGWGDLVVACSAFTPESGHGGDRGFAEMERVCRPGGCVAIVWPNNLSWLQDRGYRYLSFGDDEMFVEFASHDEAVELTRIFYPDAAAEVRRERPPASVVSDIASQSAARRRLQGGGRVKLAIVAPLVSPIREPQRGGSQAFVSELAAGLVRRGYDVHLYAASGSAVAGVEVIDTGVDHRELAATLYRPAGGGVAGTTVAERAFGRVYEMVRDGRYDLVHNHAFDAPAVRLASIQRAPVVHTVHLPPDAAVAEAIRAASRRSPWPVVACVSASHADAWRRIVPVDAILPPYIPTRQIDFSPNPGSGAVFAGRLSPEKGAADAIAIARLAGVELDLFGDSYDADYVRDKIDPHRGEPDISVHAAVPQTALWAAMGRAAVVLCPARWDEPFGMVAAEAQACGTPVVAFQRGALGEVIVDGTTGFLVEPGALDAAAEAVNRAATLSRSACREHAEARLDVELSLDAHERLYERVASGVLGARTGG